MKQSQDFQLKLTIRILQNVLSKEQGQKQKDRVMNVIQKYGKSRSRNDLKELSQPQGKLFLLLQDGFTCYKQSFMEILRADPKYRAVSDTVGFDIDQFLITIQPNINIPKDSITIQSLVAKYTYNILKVKKTYDYWPKELTSEWNNRAKDKMKKLEQKRLEATKKKEEPKVEKYSDSEDNESCEPKPKTIQAYKAPPPPPPPPQKQPEREREPERRIIPDKPQARGRIQPRQQTRGESIKELRNKLMEKYLQNRKDIHIQKGKMKQIAEFMTARLDHFMKKTVEKLLEIATLKNKKNSKFGEMAYFSAASERITPQNSLYYSANSKIYSMQYKHKLEIYTSLRSKQIKKEDELRNALQASTSETEKKVDKKIENYILKTRPKEVEPIEVFKQDKDARIVPSNTLYIYGEHLLYYLQNHRYLRNSLLLFNGYHY